ncbi:hydrophobic protein [Streptomyces sp. NPDC006335]|uniref:hydrophobic protein n=1 Tax=Streptomyces sp. NPDC006335 TaxID=3156895 RepID=UPI0033B58732
MEKPGKKGHRVPRRFGAGFALKALWWIAVIVLVVWLRGFVIRSADTGGREGRWYRW